MRRPCLPLLAALALTAAPWLPAANATPAPATVPEPAPAVTQPASAPATESKTPPATTPTPATKVIPAVAALTPSDTVLTFTLDNYNQLVAILRDKDDKCLTLETAEGLMKLRSDKVLAVVPGGTLTLTQGSGTPASGGANPGSGNTGGPLAGPTTGGNAGAVNKPLSQMTPDERIKAAQEKLKAAQAAGVVYQQAIQTHVGGVPNGIAPTAFHQPGNKPSGSQNPSGNSNNWQPFASDALTNNQGKSGNNSNRTQNPYTTNPSYQSQMYYQLLNDANGSGFANPYTQTVPLQSNR